MPIYALGDLVPDIHPSAFVHPDATIIGNVVIGAESSVWGQAVLRGDNDAIRVGSRTSIQDGAVIHVAEGLPTTVADDCVVGHLVHLESCRIESQSLIGTGSVVLHRAVVGPHGLVGAGAVVPNGMVVPVDAMALGIPAKIRPDVVDRAYIAAGAAGYVRLSRRYLAELRRID